MMWWNGAAGGVLGFAIVVFLLLFALALITGIVLLVRAIAQGGSSGGTSQALRILEERYARGEIDRDEFIQRRDDLRS